jgi:hydrogenase maturation protein HypF
MTSGNLSDEPQCIDNDDALERLAGIADAWLMHDRDIVNRVDDSVVRVMAGAPRWLRRARGAAPMPLSLPAAFDDAAPALALGSELKNTICLLQHGQAILSQHLGDLEEALTAREFERTIDLYSQLFEHRPAYVAVDLHPDYRSTVVGRALAERLDVPVISIQHHAAHLASVLADNGRELDAGPVLGIILDGLGHGADGTVWGGELLLGDYRRWRRIGHLRQVPLLGGERANREPWRNLYAQVATAFGWETFERRWGQLDAAHRLRERPIGVLGRLLDSGLGSPLGSSTGRLFDAVAAALGICFEAIAYEGQAAIELETLALQASPRQSYGLGLSQDTGRILLDPTPMWHALLDDLAAGTDPAAVAAGFHAGLAESLCRAAVLAADEHGVDTVALSGGVFQNRTLFEAVVAGLDAVGLRSLTHSRVPCNDGGLPLGQAVMAAARRLR